MKLLSSWDIKDIGENEGELRIAEILSMYLVWCKREPKQIKKVCWKQYLHDHKCLLSDLYHIDKNFAYENRLNI